MKWNRRRSILPVVAAAVAVPLVSGLLIGCEPEASGDEQQSSQPAEDDEPAAYEAPEGSAQTLAADVHRAHGGPDWQDVRQLAFRFVVSDGDDVMLDAGHDWNVADGTTEIEWDDGDERRWNVVLDIDEQQALEATIDGEDADDAELEEASADAYQRWVNDTYWLLMPIKLFDPGVELSTGESIDDRQRAVDVLELSFEDVGLTPGDRYDVRIDPDSHRVSSWKMMLQGRDEPTEVDWDDYREVGPLTLPMERNWRPSDQQISFRDVSVDTATDEDHHEEP